MTAYYIADATFDALIDSLVVATSTLHDMPELVERNAIITALGETGDVWPASIEPKDARQADRSLRAHEIINGLDAAEIFELVAVIERRQLIEARERTAA